MTQRTAASPRSRPPTQKGTVKATSRSLTVTGRRPRSSPAPTARCGSRANEQRRPLHARRNPKKRKRSSVTEMSPRDIDVAGSLLVIADANDARIVTMTTSAASKAKSRSAQGREIEVASQGVAGTPERADRLLAARRATRGARAGRPRRRRPRFPSKPGDPLRRRLRLRRRLLVRAVGRRDSLERLTPERRSDTSSVDVPAGFFPRQIAAGPNNTLWVTAGKPGRKPLRSRQVSGLEPPPGPDSKASGPRDQDRQGPEGQGQDQGQDGQGQVHLQLADRRRQVRMRHRQAPQRQAQKRAEAQVQGLQVAEEADS